MSCWTPDFIPFSFPFIACSLIGPGAVHTAIRPPLYGPDGEENPHYLRRQMLELILRKIAENWSIGFQLLGSLFRPEIHKNIADRYRLVEIPRCIDTLE